jgi:serine/threonine protein phosphatase PrpC
MTWALQRFDCVVGFGGASHVGHVRKNNEDAWTIDPSVGVFIVADGMGGHAAGEVAAGIAVDCVGASIKNRQAFDAMDEFVRGPTLEARTKVFDALVDAVNQAHTAVCEEASRNHRLRRMGCTLDVVLLLGRQMFVAHVGDGRVYLARPTTMIQLTNDHTLKSSLMLGGAATPSQPPEGREALVNAIGRPGKIRVDDVYTELEPGDRIMLCSDGVYGELKDEAQIATSSFPFYYRYIDHATWTRSSECSI